MTDLQTERLRLRPVRSSDADDIERYILAEPEIVKGLAHNGADPEKRRFHAREWSGFGPDGDYPFWDACQTGLYVIEDRSGTIAGPDTFLGVCGVFLEPEDNTWCGELFYALALPYQGKGIMSEAVAAVLRRFDQVPDAGYLYAVFWQLLNPASGRVLNKTGFVREGTRPLLEEYPIELYLGIREFELWRLTRVSPDRFDDTLKEVAIKLGHLEKEGIVLRQANLDDLQSALGVGVLQDPVINYLGLGFSTPGFGLLKYRPGSSQ